MRDAAPSRDPQPPLQLDRASWRELSVQDKHLLYGYGYVIAEGIVALLVQQQSLAAA